MNDSIRRSSLSKIGMEYFFRLMTDYFHWAYSKWILIYEWSDGFHCSLALCLYISISDQACLEWEEPKLDNGMKIKGYQIYVDNKALGSMRSPDIRQMVINNLVPGQSHCLSLSPSISFLSLLFSWSLCHLSCYPFLVSFKHPTLPYKDEWREAEVDNEEMPPFMCLCSLKTRHNFCLRSLLCRKIASH